MSTRPRGPSRPFPRPEQALVTWGQHGAGLDPPLRLSRHVGFGAAPRGLHADKGGLVRAHA